MTVNETVVNIELQVKNEGFYQDRALFYWSKLYAGELKSGDDYSKLRTSISINIINFKLFDWDKFHSEFTMLEKEKNKPLSDKCAIHFFELPKINKKNLSKDRKELWMQLINAESEEELDMLMQTNVPEIKETVFIIKNMSDDDRIRESARIRERALHDRATALNGAEAKGRAEGRAEGIEEGIVKGRVDLIEELRKSGIDVDALFKEHNIKL